MALEYITQVVKIKGITSTQKLILFCLANYSSEDGYSYPSHEKIAEVTCLSRDSVLKNLRTLKGLGLVTWEKRNNTSNLYQLLFDRVSSVSHELCCDYWCKSRNRPRIMQAISRKWKPSICNLPKQYGRS